MESRPLGATGVKVAEICLGTGQFGWTARPADAPRLLDTYASAGGNFVDTADIYTQWVDGHRGGESETIVGAWMRTKGNRRGIILATKARGRMWPGPTGEGLSRAHLVKACEDSLKRLRTDYIDLYQSHWEDRTTPIAETLAAYGDLIRAGKVRWIGASNFSAGALAEALVTGGRAGLPRYVCYQPFYNLWDRSLEQDHVWLLRKYRVACIPYTPLGQGFYTGKYRKGRPLPKSRRAEHVAKRYFSDKGWAVLAALERLGRKRGKTPTQMTLAWHLSHDWMTAPIVGPNTLAQLQDDLGAVGLKLTPAEIEELNRLSG